MSLKNEKGFTLIELLLSVFMLAIISSVIFTSFSSVIMAVEKNQVIADEYQIVRAVMSRMSDEISGTFLEKPQKKKETVFKFIGEDSALDGNPADKLYFTTTASRWLKKDTKENELSEIEYYLKISSDGKRKNLYRKQDSVIDANFEKEGLEFIESLTGIDYKYFDENAEETDEWNSDERESSQTLLPQAVKITLTFGDENSGLRKYSTIVPVEIDF